MASEMLTFAAIPLTDNFKKTEIFAHLLTVIFSLPAPHRPESHWSPLSPLPARCCTQGGCASTLGLIKPFSTLGLIRLNSRVYKTFLNIRVNKTLLNSRVYKTFLKIWVNKTFLNIRVNKTFPNIRVNKTFQH
jgi:hypothetical protein